MLLTNNPENRFNGFAVVLTYHRTWGIVLVPFIIRAEPEHRFYTVQESLSPHPSSTTLSTLSSEDRQVIKLINDYSEKNLHRLFSKEANTKKFIASLSEDIFSKLIRPYIESKIYKALSIIRDEAIPLFHQKSKSINIHHDDLLTLHSANIETVFNFCRTNDGTLYSLGIIHEGNPVDIRNNETDIIINSPSVIRSESNIFFIPDLDSVKLKPFFSKDNIVIPASAEKRYYESFILSAVNNNNVQAEGFSIIDRTPEKSIRLIVEQGIKGLPVLVLYYSYSGNIIKSDDTRSLFTHLMHENNSFYFIRYHRDKNWEEECRAILGDHGFFSDDNINFMLYSEVDGRADDILQLIEAINKSYNHLTAAGFVIKTGSLEHNYNIKNISIDTKYTIDDDWFDISSVVKIGEFSIPFVKLRNHLLSNRRLFTLPDGTTAVLPEEWFTTYRDLFGLGKESNGSLLIHKQHFPVLNEAIGEDSDSKYQELERLVMPDKLPATKLPKGLMAKMRPYQKEGYYWMLFLQSNGLGGCLADDMGLGKTLQAIALLLHNKETDKNRLPAKEDVVNEEGTDNNRQLELFNSYKSKRSTLIIVPASLLHNWGNEVKRYAPALKLFVYKGINRRKSTSYFGYYDLILSSYHTVRQDIDIIAAYTFHYIILDESQVIKNPSSAVYKAVSRLRSHHKLVLSGTPVENSLTDLWTQMNFINHGLLGNLLYFKNEYARPVEKKSDYGKEEKLKTIIKPFILRRTKDMVAKELPPVWEQTVYCDMTNEQSSIYEKEKSAIRNSILSSSSGTDRSAIVVLQGLMRLRQVANHPVMAIDDYINGSGKFDIVLNDIKSVSAENHKILVFSSFVKHLNLYAEALKKEGIRYSMLTGSTINREAVVKEFHNDQSRSVFLISLKAGGVGLNLTAADYVFILDPWWNPAVETQAMNRAHRIGQKKNVFVFRYISADTIEEKIISLQERKSKIADTFINSNNPVKDMNIEQILEIIG